MEKKSGSSRNFPIGTFYDEKRSKIFFFFRQGEAFHMELDLFPERNTEDEIICQKLTDYNFGSAFMYAGQILVAKSSSTFMFYRLVQVSLEDEEHEGKQGRVVLQWKQYHTLSM